MYNIIISVECDGHKFGQNCSNTCGHCLGNEQCYPVNGSCLNGCILGYHGTNCTQGKRDNVCFIHDHL